MFAGRPTMRVGRRHFLGGGQSEKAASKHEGIMIVLIKLKESLDCSQCERIKYCFRLDLFIAMFHVYNFHTSRWKHDTKQTRWNLEVTPSMDIKSSSKNQHITRPATSKVTTAALVPCVLGAPPVPGPLLNLKV